MLLFLQSLVRIIILNTNPLSPFHDLFLAVQRLLIGVSIGATAVELETSSGEANNVSKFLCNGPDSLHLLSKIHTINKKITLHKFNYMKK